MKRILTLLILALMVFGCKESTSQEKKDSETVNQQQSQYAKAQPVPFFDWSLERDLVAQLYRIRNSKVATHAVWRSNYGLIEGDCPSMGFGLPYDTSLTNPLKVMWGYNGASSSVEQAEPNGVFASKNTSATWVMCVGKSGIIEPVYIESKVTIYPGPVSVDYQTNRVVRSGEATVKITQ